MSDWQIIPAIEADYARLAEAFTCAFSDYFVPVQLTAKVLEQICRAENADLGSSLIAVQDDHIIGLLLVGRRGWSSRVNSMGVLPDARRKGVARALLERCITEAEARGDKSLVLEVIEANERARALYRSLNFRKTRRLVSYFCDSPEPCQDPDFVELDPIAVARQMCQAGQCGLPWQLSAETFAHATRPTRAFALADRAFVIVGPPAPENMGIRCIWVPPAFRRQGWGSRAISALFAQYPDRVWRIPALVPEDLADEFLAEHGFQRDTLAQFEMKLDLVS